VSGTLTATDPDAGESAFVAQTVTGTYGTFSITSAGAWTYTLDNTNPAVQALGIGDPALAETVFTVSTLDGTDTETVTITVTPTNDAPVIHFAIDAPTVTENAVAQTVALIPAGSITDVDTTDVLSVVALSLTQTEGRTLPSAALSGNDLTFNPADFKTRVMGVWESGAVRINGALNYVGEYTNDLVTPNQNVDSWTTLDLGIAITPGDEMASVLDGGITIGLDIRNVFDEQPPYVNLSPNINGSGGFDATAANPVGRVIGVSLRKKW
jgi:VCBS repeat-containing protein